MKLVLIAEVVLVAIVQLGLARGKYVTSQHGGQPRDVWLDDFDKVRINELRDKYNAIK